MRRIALPTAAAAASIAIAGATVHANPADVATFISACFLTPTSPG